MTIQIIGIRTVEYVLGKKGVTYVARFDVAIGDLMRLENCLLVEAEKGHNVWTPQADKASGTTGVRLSAGLRRAVTESAVAALAALNAAPRVPYDGLSAAAALVREVEARA